MSISIVGGVILLKLITDSFINFNKPKLIMTNLTLLIIISALFIDIGYLIKINEFTLDYYKFLLLINIVYVFFYILFCKKMMISKKVFFLIFMLDMILIMVIVFFKLYDSNILIFPSSAGYDDIVKNGVTVLKTVEITSYNFLSFAALATFQFFLLFNIKLIDEKTLDKIKKIYHFIFILILIEFLVINLFEINSRVFWDYFFGMRSNQISRVMTRNSIKLAYGPFSEPSHIATFLLVYYNLYFEKRDLNKKDIFFLISTVIIGLISGGTSTIVVSIVFFTYIIYRYLFRIKTKILTKLRLYFLLIISCVLLLLLSSEMAEIFAYTYNKILNFTKTQGSRSAVARSSVLIFTMQSFLQSFLFGVGYGSTKAPGLIPTLLVNLGIVNAYLYVYSIVKSIKINFNIKIKIEKILINMFLLMFIGQFSHTHSPIIILVVLGVLYSGSGKIRLEEERIK